MNHSRIRRGIAYFLTALLCLSLIPYIPRIAEAAELDVWDGAKDVAWFEEQLASEDSGDDGYIEVHISKPGELASFAAWANKSTANDAEKCKIVLDNDIVLNDESTSNVWDPIQQFDGVFDGGGYSVKGILINDDSRYPNNYHYGSTYDGFVGFFSMSGGHIKNLTVHGSYDATAGLEYSNSTLQGVTTAGIVGRLTSSGIVENCSNYVKMLHLSEIERATDDGWASAGIVGISNGSILRCSNYSELVSEGIVGQSWGTTTPVEIKNCINYADLSGFSVAGIVGTANGSTLSDCLNFGDLKGKYQIGGIASVIGGSNTCLVERCANFGNIFLCETDDFINPSAGGLIGYNYHSAGSSHEIHESFNCGSICINHESGADIICVGGLLGNCGSSIKLDNCYNIGSIDLSKSTANDIRVGGLGSFWSWSDYSLTMDGCYSAGKIVSSENVSMPAFFSHEPSGELSITNSFYSSDDFAATFGTAKLPGNPASIEELKSQATITSLNKNGDYWKADTNKLNDGYPVLKWETINHSTGSSDAPEDDNLENVNIHYSTTLDLTEGEGSEWRTKTSVKWGDSLFSQPATTYNHDLAKLGSSMSAMLYGEGRYINESSSQTILTSVENGRTQLTEYPSNTARENSYTWPTLRGMGFSDYDIENYYYRDEERAVDYDTVAYTLATKTIHVDGTEKPLVMVLVRGTAANAEWISNANVADTLKTFDDYHEGFLHAATEVEVGLTDFLEARGIERDNALFFVTGHSRGAAVANLVSAQLSNGDKNGTNVYAYTFAAPNCVSEELIAGTDYGNIFNIVNPEDVVARVPLEKWGYGKYGITLYTPSSSNASGYYQDLLPSMQESFYGLTFQKEYKPYLEGTLASRTVASAVYALCPNVDSIYEEKFSLLEEHSYWTRFTSLSSLLKACLKMVYVNTEDLTTQETLAVALGVGECIGGIGKILAGFGFTATIVGAGAAGTAAYATALHVGPRVAHAHTAETYMAWMMSSDSQSIYKQRYKGLSIACPVNVYVKDANNNLVAKIEDDVVDKNIMAQGLPAMVDENGTKIIDIPDDGDYSVAIVATADGEMDYSVSEFDGDGRTLRKVNFFDIKLVEGNTFEGYVPSGEGNPSVDYSLTTNNETIGPDADLSGDNVNDLEVTVSADGEGNVSGNAVVTAGETVLISAMPYNNASFEGWYEDGRLVSTKADYSIRIDKSHDFVAVFKSATSENPSQNDSSIIPDASDEAATDSVEKETTAKTMDSALAVGYGLFGCAVLSGIVCLLALRMRRRNN